jgi:hypothetical protein
LSGGVAVTRYCGGLGWIPAVIPPSQYAMAQIKTPPDAERTTMEDSPGSRWRGRFIRYVTWKDRYGAWSVARADRKRLRKLIRDALPAVAGEYEALGGANEFRYWKRVGEWRVCTHIDLSSRQQQLIYHHSVELDPANSLVEFESLMSWLGLSGETSWNTLPPGKEHEAVENLRTLCQRFLDSLPSLLEGL